MIYSYASVLFYLLISFKLTYCERLHEQIYSSIEGGAACFRRMNGTHQAGCTSSEKGTVGVVHMVTNVGDVQWLVHNASAGPYMAVVSTSLFYDVVELMMSNPDNIAGVLLYDDAAAKEFSQESRCPNEYYSAPGSQCSSSEAGGIVWNNKGTGLIRRDIPFPIFYLPESRRVEEIDKIQKCYDRYNSDWDNQKGNPLCSLQLNTFMFAAVNSMVCMRRSASATVLTTNKVCDPLGDHNVYYSLFPRNKETKATKKPVHLVTARIDTASLFDGVAPGAASSVVGMVTLITAATTLAKMISVNDSQLYDSNVLWTLFNGEAFDYIGSQRVAHDLSKGAWPPVAPLTPSDVRLHVELGQLGGSLATADGLTVVHAFFPTSDSPKITEFLQTLEKNTDVYKMGLVRQNTNNLPPSSLHSFRRILKNVTTSGELPEVLLVDHGETFSNKFYHSVLDDFDKIRFNYHNISIGNDGKFISTEALLANGTMKESEPQVQISRLATAVARTLYKQVTQKEYVGDMTASAHLVDEMLYCFLKSQACRLLLAADYAQTGGGEEALPARASPLYVGVVTWPNTPAVFAGHLLALLTGNHLNVSRAGCEKQANPEFSYYWLKGWNHSGICIETTMNFSQALSPAFTITDYEYSSGLYSTWTESVWRALWARVFVAAGGGGARAAASAGGVLTVVAGLATHWLRRHARLIFRDASAVSTDAAAGILRSVNC